MRTESESPPNGSVREKIVTAMPDYGDMLANITEMVQANNRKMVEELLREQRDFQTLSLMVDSTADVAPFRIVAPFDIRHILIQNHSAISVIIGESPGSTGANNFVVVPPMHNVSLPAHFGKVAFARFTGAIVNYGLADFVRVFVSSAPMAPFIQPRITVPVVFKDFTATAATSDVTIWTPASGKRVRALGMHMGAGGGVTHTILNGSGGSVLWRTFRTSFGNVWDFGNRGIVGSRDTALVLTRDASVGVTGSIFGIEE